MSAQELVATLNLLSSRPQSRIWTAVAPNHPKANREDRRAEQVGQRIKFLQRDLVLVSEYPHQVAQPVPQHRRENRARQKHNGSQHHAQARGRSEPEQSDMKNPEDYANRYSKRYGLKATAQSMKQHSAERNFLKDRWHNAKEENQLRRRDVRRDNILLELAQHPGRDGNKEIGQTKQTRSSEKPARNRH